MRAVLVKDGKGPVENLYIGETPDPTLREDDVLVKVTYSVHLSACPRPTVPRSKLSASIVWILVKERATTPLQLDHPIS